MISNFKLFPYFNISQNFVQNVQQQKENTLSPELDYRAHTKYGKDNVFILSVLLLI